MNDTIELTREDIENYMRLGKMHDVMCKCHAEFQKLNDEMRERQMVLREEQRNV